MMQGPKITVVTACYNAADTIEQTIQSVLNQNYSNLEYIIVDGASTDHTMSIVNKYKDRISFIVSEPDKGIYDAFNKGVHLATGDFINFMNADDYFSTDQVLGEVADYLTLNPDVLMLYGNVRMENDVLAIWHVEGEPLTVDDLKRGKVCKHQSVFAHKQLFEEFGGFDQGFTIAADTDFIFKCFRKYEEHIDYIPLEIASFRIGGVSTNVQYEKRMYSEVAMVHLKNFQHIDQKSVNYIESADQIQSGNYYQLWVQHLLLDSAGAATKLLGAKNDKVIIFGTRKLATFLYLDFQKQGIEVEYFLDNDQRMQGNSMHNIPIISPMELDTTAKMTIVVSVERQSSMNVVKASLSEQFNNAQIYTWQELFS